MSPVKCPVCGGNLSSGECVNRNCNLSDHICVVFVDETLVEMPHCLCICQGQHVKCQQCTGNLDLLYGVCVNTRCVSCPEYVPPLTPCRCNDDLQTCPASVHHTCTISRVGGLDFRVLDCEAFHERCSGCTRKLYPDPQYVEAVCVNPGCPLSLQNHVDERCPYCLVPGALRSNYYEPLEQKTQGDCRVYHNRDCPTSKCLGCGEQFGRLDVLTLSRHCSICMCSDTVKSQYFLGVFDNSAEIALARQRTWAVIGRRFEGDELPPQYDDVTPRHPPTYSPYPSDARSEPPPSYRDGNLSLLSGQCLNSLCQPDVAEAEREAERAKQPLSDSEIPGLKEGGG